MKNKKPNDQKNNFFLKYPIGFGLFFGFVLSGANAILNYFLNIDQNSIPNAVLYFTVASGIGTAIAYFMKWKKEKTYK